MEGIGLRKDSCVTGFRVVSLRGGMAGLAALCLALVLGGTPGRAADHPVATAEALAAAWAAAAPGDRIVLAPGDYGHIAVKGGGGTADRPVVLTSADGTDPARIQELFLRGVSHVVLTGLVLDYRFQPSDALGARPFGIYDSTDVTLSNVLIDGDLAHDLNASSDGLPAGFGLAVANTDGVTLQNSEIRGFWRGLTVRESRNIEVLGNRLHSLRMDGMNFAQVEDVLIERNRIFDFDRSPTSEDHADMIQFWTGHTTAPTRGVTIRGNLLQSGDGLFTQSIFMGNNLVDQNKAGEEMYFRDIAIVDNLIINAHAHGISLGASLGVRISGNVLVHNPASDGDRDILKLYRPRLHVSPLSRDVTVEDNVASEFVLPDPQDAPEWRMARNVAAQDIARMQPYHYSTVFAGGDPADPASYMPRPGGVLDGTGVARVVGAWVD